MSALSRECVKTRSKTKRIKFDFVGCFLSHDLSISKGEVCPVFSYFEFPHSLSTKQLYRVSRDISIPTPAWSSIRTQKKYA